MDEVIWCLRFVPKLSRQLCRWDIKLREKKPTYFTSSNLTSRYLLRRIHIYVYKNLYANVYNTFIHKISQTGNSPSVHQLGTV